MIKYIFFFLLIFIACSKQEQSVSETTDTGKAVGAQAEGALFIIGGGSRPPELLLELADISGLEEGYGIVLPMASIEPDSAAYYAIQQFYNITSAPVIPFYLSNGNVSESQLDSLLNARLIYIAGGDQNRFMDTIRNTRVADVIRNAYLSGATIAGTSAGAAVMSKKMITGNEKRHPDYESTFRNIEFDNIELGEGLGLLENVIIDQHFVKRSRYNRLISAVIEFPELTGIGIDESTAIVVQNNKIRVTGESQVIVISNPSQSINKKGILLGANNLRLNVLLPGEFITLQE